MAVLLNAVNDGKKSIERQQVSTVQASHWKCILQHMRANICVSSTSN